MTDKIDTSAEAVEAIAFEYDERAKIAAELIALCPQSELRMERSKPSRDFHTKTAATLRALQAEADANEHVAEGLSRENAVLKAEVERLREELSQHDGDLDQRMAALGMIPLSQLLSEPPTPFSVHAAMNSLEFFAEWVERKHAEYLKMRMRYEIGKRTKDDGMFEWVFAHSATFGEVHDNLRAALKGGSDAKTND